MIVNVIHLTTDHVTGSDYFYVPCPWRRVHNCHRRFTFPHKLI